jgi:hypothetical protein
MPLPAVVLVDGLGCFGAGFEPAGPEDCWGAEAAGVAEAEATGAVELLVVGEADVRPAG